MPVVSENRFIAISPWIPKGTVVGDPVDGPFPDSKYDSTSLVGTIKELFGLPNFLTKRDEWSGKFTSLLLDELDSPREDCPMHLPDAPAPATWSRVVKGLKRRGRGDGRDNDDDDDDEDGDLDVGDDGDGDNCDQRELSAHRCESCRETTHTDARSRTHPQPRGANGDRYRSQRTCLESRHHNIYTHARTPNPIGCTGVPEFPGRMPQTG